RMNNPIVRIGYPWWLRPLVHRNTIALTLGRRIYIAADLEGEAMEALLRHELVHVRQAGERGLGVFVWKYIAEYLRNRRRGLNHDAAYRAISFEVEAFAAELDEPV
nr:DUF4157 domain-containing protein [Acidobacteriota bacterium]